MSAFLRLVQSGEAAAAANPDADLRADLFAQVGQLVRQRLLSMEHSLDGPRIRCMARELGTPLSLARPAAVSPHGLVLRADWARAGAAAGCEPRAVARPGGAAAVTCENNK